MEPADQDLEGLSDAALSQQLWQYETDLRALNERRKGVVDALKLVQDEVLARRRVREEEKALIRREQAVAAGQAYSTPGVAATTRAAATRLAGLSLSVGKVVVQTLPEKPPEFTPYVTDHALVRYLERVVGLDVEGFRGEILSKVVRVALTRGDAKITTPDYQIKADQGRVVTIIVPEIPKKRVHHKSRIMDRVVDRGPSVNDWDGEQDG